ncbi:platelet formation protein family [Trichomonas vaginalis G3]|uniref:platelet formation protein family n=1 Tax=Trichomonas vaginalis (strain ATCC PRA-98 / G3) TaxID=412133 RepID=UPI0021E5B1FE|nr:platelet formation protein family [Trichomonas vaginalis G3]KAI5488198.1 platelet formation protein family [Trichomonas vaginalis G3]
MGRAITFIFSGITAYTIDMGTLTDFFKHVQHLIENKLLRLEDVGNTGFIDYCFFISNTKQFTELLMKPTFLSILSSIIRLYDFGIHWKIFKIVLSKEHDFPQYDFTDICLKLFQGEDVKVLMNPLLKYIGQNPSDALISILMSSFMQNEDSVSIFVKENGMEWISQLMEKKFFNPSSLTIFISSMLHMSFVPEISLWINSQPLDSMIFSLSEEMVFHLVYGPNVIYQLYIQIPSLLPLLNVNNLELNPYSQYISSKYGFSEFIRHKSPIDGNHIIKDLANRYIIPYQFCFLLKNSKKLVEFADKSYDHFSMFQLNKNTADPYFVIPENCKAISFWIKTEHINEKSIKIMSCSALSLSVNSNEATFNFLGQDYSVPFSENEWTFIVIAITVVNNRKVMYLTCGSKTYDIKYSQNIDQISEIVMGSKQSLSTIWYLGSSIRLFSAFHPSILSLKHNGPSLMRISKIPSESLVITPFSKIKQIGKGAVLVPYNGFPSFIKRKRHFIEMIAEILVSKDKDRINDIYETLLNCFEIFQGKVMDFWIHIVRVIKERHEFISIENISSTISIFIQYATQGMIESNVQPLIYDINMWTLYHDELYNQIMQKMNKSNVSSKIFQSNFVKTIISLFSLEKNEEKQEHYLDIFFARLELEPSLDLFNHLYYLIVSYNSNPLVISIISHFKNMMKKINCDLVSEVFNFDSCSSLLAVLDSSMQIEIMEIMTYLASSSPNYYQNNDVFLYYILSLSSQRFTWITALCLIYGEKYQENLTVSNFTSKNVKYPEAIKLIVSLTLMSIFFHQLSPCFPPESIKPEFKSLNEITTEVEKFLIKLLERQPDLFKTDDLYQTLLFFIPTLFSPEIANFFSMAEPYEIESLPLFQNKHYKTLSRIWDISEHYMDSLIVSNENTFYQSSVAPLMSMYANVGSILFENFSYDNKGFLPSYHFNTNYINISEFIGSYILIFQNQPDKFKEIIDCLIVDSEYKMYSLTIDIVSYIMTHIHKYDINMSTLRYLVLFNLSIISKVLYNFSRFPLYIGFMHLIYNISGLTISDPRIYSDIRFCFAIILNFITSSELSELSKEINQIPNFFSKVEPFLSDLNLVLFTTLKFISALQDKSCDSDKFITDFFKIIAIPQSMSNNQNSSNLIDALTIQKFMVGIKLLTTGGTGSFNRWCVDNSEVF